MKVKSIDKLEMVQNGYDVHLEATVTFTDGIKDYVSSFRSAEINPQNREQAYVDAYLKESLQKAIMAYLDILDKKVVDAVKTESMRTSILSELSKVGLTIMLALMLLWCVPALVYAGDLTPSYGAQYALYPTNVADRPAVTGGVTVATNGVSPTWIGTINGTTNYWTSIWAWVYEEHGNIAAPTGNVGVSVYFLNQNYPASPGTAGTAATAWGTRPSAVVEFGGRDYFMAAAVDTGAGVAWGTGATVFIGTFENVPYIGVAASQNQPVATDKYNVQIIYRHGRGQY